MTDMNGTEALDSVRIRFKVLKQAKAGDIIILDASGRWLLQSPSSWMHWRSAVRKVVAFFSQSPVESQRQAFLKSAKESVRTIIYHSRLLMKTQLFAKSTDETGVISVKSMQKLCASDVTDLEVLLSTIKSFCTDLHEGLTGLDNVVKHQPYADDLTYCSEIQVSLCDPVRDFLEQTYRHMGIFGPKLLPFLNKPTVAATTTTTTAPPSTFPGFVFAAPSVAPLPPLPAPPAVEDIVSASTLPRALSTSSLVANTPPGSAVPSVLFSKAKK